MTQIETRERIKTLQPSSPKEARNGQLGRRWLIAALVVIFVIGVLGSKSNLA
jgi:hypothetical protein